MCFLSVPFCMPFPLLSNFHFPSSSLPGDKYSLYHWEKRSSQRRTSASLPRTSSHFTASRPIYSVFSSIEDKLFILPTKASPTIPALNPMPSYLLNDLEQFFTQQFLSNSSLSVMYHLSSALLGIVPISIHIQFFLS